MLNRVDFTFIFVITYVPTPLLSVLIQKVTNAEGIPLGEIKPACRTDRAVRIWPEHLSMPLKSIPSFVLKHKTFLYAPFQSAPRHPNSQGRILNRCTIKILHFGPPTSSHLDAKKEEKGNKKTHRFHTDVIESK